MSENHNPTGLPKELYHPGADILSCLKSGQRVVINYIYLELMPVIRSIGSVYEPQTNQAIIYDTRNLVFSQGGREISFTITDWHYPDGECEFGLGTWSAKPYTCDLSDLQEMQQLGFLNPDYSLAKVARSLNNY